MGSFPAIHPGPNQLKPLGKQGLMSRRQANTVLAVCNAYLNRKITHGTADAVHITANNVIDEIGPDTSAATAGSTIFHPFKIYNVPSTDPAIASWRCWQVRGGFLGWRPRYFVDALFGNQESLNTVASGTDQIVGNDSAIGFDYFSTSQTLWPGGTKESITVPIGTVGDPGYVSSGVSVYGNAATFILDDTLDDNDCIQASFWAYVVDDGTNYTFDIRCRRFGEIPLGAAPNRDPFPGDDRYIIPIGIVRPRETLNFPSNPADLVTVQYTASHLTNRWTHNIAWGSNISPPTGTSGGARLGRNELNWRGLWVGTDDWGLSGQVYYIDDVVTTFDTITDSNGDTFNSYKSWRYTYGNPSIVTDAPDVDPTPWNALGSGF